jgi:hypothetical protein
MTIHQCGKKESISFLGFSFNQQCKCKHNTEKEHPNKCCRDKTVLVKGKHTDKISHSVVVAKLISKNSIAVVPNFISTNAVVANTSTAFLLPDYPPNYSTPLYLQNRVLLI